MLEWLKGGVGGVETYAIVDEHLTSVANLYTILASERKTGYEMKLVSKKIGAVVGMEHFNAVILAGGSGTRLLPVSTPSFPKQIFPLPNGRNLIQETLARVEALFFP